MAVNIKNLPETEEINNGDYFLLESPVGTQILKYDNFIISEKHTTFEPLLSTHTSDIFFNLTQIKSLTANTETLSGWFSPSYRPITGGGDCITTLSAIGINHTNPGEKLTIGGNLSASGSLSAAGGGYNYLENRLGIGTRTPGSHLDIEAGFPELRLTRTDGMYTNFVQSHKGLFLQVDQGNVTAGTSFVLRIDDDEKMRITDNGLVGIGTSNPNTCLHIANSGSLGMVETNEHPATPTANGEAFFYIKADKFIIKFNDGGTLRYKYMVLSGDHVTWVQTLTAP